MLALLIRVTGRHVRTCWPRALTVLVATMAVNGYIAAEGRLALWKLSVRVLSAAAARGGHIRPFGRGEATPRRASPDDWAKFVAIKRPLGRAGGERAVLCCPRFWDGWAGGAAPGVSEESRGLAVESLPVEVEAEVAVSEEGASAAPPRLLHRPRPFAAFGRFGVLTGLRDERPALSRAGTASPAGNVTAILRRAAGSPRGSIDFCTLVRGEGAGIHEGTRAWGGTWWEAVEGEDTVVNKAARGEEALLRC